MFASKCNKKDEVEQKNSPILTKENKYRDIEKFRTKLDGQIDG